MTYANYGKTVVLDYRQSGNLPGRYITAVICDILGYSNECFILTEMRSFEDKMPEKYGNKGWLFAYDVAEPVIAEKIAEEYNTTHDKNTWVQVYNLFLSEMASLMGSEKYHEALGNYQRMMEVLKAHFKIDDVELMLCHHEKDNLSDERGFFKAKLLVEK